MSPSRRLLLDTHTLLWWLDGDEALSPLARTWILEPKHEVLVSAASAWEVCTKARIGKLPGALDVAQNFSQVVHEQGFTPLSITLRQGQRAGTLPGPHRDPFDRMLVAQALEEDLVLISNEKIFDSYGITRIW